MSCFVLKIIACIAMFIGHIPFVFPDTAIPCILIGKISFPIFAFLISEGYIHTRNWKRYLIRLLVLAIISQLPATLLFNPNFSSLYLNIFFTLALGLISICIFDKIKFKPLAVFLVLFLAFISELSGCDFGFIGVFMIFFFYLFKDKKNIMVISEFLLMLTIFVQKFNNYSVINVTIIKYLLLQLLFTVIALLFILFYNGKHGKYNRNIQLGFYLFYPVHLTFLCILKLFVW